MVFWNHVANHCKLDNTAANAPLRHSNVTCTATNVIIHR